MTDTIKTARAAGAWYLGLAITGMLGFLVLRPQVTDADSPAATLANLTDHAAQAHLLVLLEMSIVVTQALAAVFFFKLFRPLNPTAAYATATFGMVNAVAIMASGAFMATANAVAADPHLAPGGDAAGTVGLLYELSASSWGMGNLFFGLWLIPMGWVALTSGRFPRVMGWILVVGGVGYVLSGLAAYGIADAPSAVTEGLAFPATVGEFWMIGYLLVKGIRPAPSM
ncbi:DUF4386 domain-containing protein [Demequina sp. TTPB684]|uniref:DUF4386 domain-containing protein n=1 Tax=unclassified Demequina TaxID=2620311 RepID=UPI001CF1EBDF|nr:MULTISPECIES: DUF4386 domain-containing protein [unclassified Demequina]MCB2412055.1 DUF4386 domain-containing protein [Demequina sp. TTPB684]UPU88020.1 DUF4386 domain-containing protein [Demequina sp. TMPB413]